MLDTGIDIPEILNLVFAKPVKSPVKFWQMIGRGTRLKENLFGPGRHKKIFRIFDHWGNFERFEMGYRPAEPTQSKPLLQLVFEERINLAETALRQSEIAVFDADQISSERTLRPFPKSRSPCGRNGARSVLCPRRPRSRPSHRPPLRCFGRSSRR